MFDGRAHALKEGTCEKRQEAKRRAERECEEALARGDRRRAEEFAQRAVRGRRQMTDELIACLRRGKLCGKGPGLCDGAPVDFVVAPYEADAQLAHLARRGAAGHADGVHAIITEDSDLLVYGAPCDVLFKFDESGNALAVDVRNVLAAAPAWHVADGRATPAMAEAARTNGGGSSGGGAGGGGTPPPEPAAAVAGAGAPRAGQAPPAVPAAVPESPIVLEARARALADGQQVCDELERLHRATAPRGGDDPRGAQRPTLSACNQHLLGMQQHAQQQRAHELEQEQQQQQQLQDQQAGGSQVRQASQYSSQSLPSTGGGSAPTSRPGSRAGNPSRAGSRGGGSGGKGSEVSFFGWTEEMFRGMCVLSGCDFVDSAPGWGLKRAHALLAKYRSFDRALAVVVAEAARKKHALPPGFAQRCRVSFAAFSHMHVWKAHEERVAPLTDLDRELVAKIEQERAHVQQRHRGGDGGGECGGGGDSAEASPMGFLASVARMERRTGAEPQAQAQSQPSGGSGAGANGIQWRMALGISVADDDRRIARGDAADDAGRWRDIARGAINPESGERVRVWTPWQQEAPRQPGQRKLSFLSPKNGNAGSRGSVFGDVRVSSSKRSAPSVAGRDSRPSGDLNDYEIQQFRALGVPLPDAAPRDSMTAGGATTDVPAAGDKGGGAPSPPVLASAGGAAAVRRGAGGGLLRLRAPSASQMPGKKAKAKKARRSS